MDADGNFRPFWKSDPHTAVDPGAMETPVGAAPHAGA